MRAIECAVDPPYPVLVGSLGDTLVRQTLSRQRDENGWVAPVVVITDETVGPLHAFPLLRLLEDLSLDPKLFTVRAGEESKSLATFESLCRDLLDAGASRRSVVAALGGGVVGDLAGFVAAAYGRGIPWVAFPTTLLAQVDSAIGGKVAVNLGEAKNIVGAFHQPRLVVADPAVLATLPAREYGSGLVEILKAALINDLQLLDLLDDGREEILDRASDRLEEAIVRSVAVKCRIVAEDERESGRRRILNLGHTFGHALEAVTGFRRYLHGEAVAVGLSAALWLSWRMGFVDAGAVERVESLLVAWDLPVRAMGQDPEAIERLMGYDKKFVRGTPVFVLLKGWGDPVVVEKPPVDLVREAVRRMVGQEERR